MTCAPRSSCGWRAGPGVGGGSVRVGVVVNLLAMCCRKWEAAFGPSDAAELLRCACAAEGSKAAGNDGCGGRLNSVLKRPRGGVVWVLDSRRPTAHGGPEARCCHPKYFALAALPAHRRYAVLGAPSPIDIVQKLQSRWAAWVCDGSRCRLGCAVRKSWAFFFGPGGLFLP
jgi:hypothetical protein